MIGARSIVSGALATIMSQEHATGIHNPVRPIKSRIHGQDEMLWSILVAYFERLFHIVKHHYAAMTQGRTCHLLAGQGLQLPLNLGKDGTCHIPAVGEEYTLRVHAVLCLTEHVGGNVFGVTGLVCHYGHFRGTCRHVNGHIGHAYLLLGTGDILVAGTEYLAHLGYCFRSIRHCADGLHASALVYAVHSGHLGGIEYGWMQFALRRRGRAQHYVGTTCYLCRSGKHQHGAEQGGCASGYVKSHLLYGHRLLPAMHARGGFHTDGLHALGLVETVYVGMGKIDGLLQFLAYKSLCFLQFLFGNGQRGKFCLVKLCLIAQYGIVSLHAHIIEHGGYGCAQIGGILVRTAEQCLVVFLSGV